MWQWIIHSPRFDATISRSTVDPHRHQHRVLPREIAVLDPVARQHQKALAMQVDRMVHRMKRIRVWTRMGGQPRQHHSIPTQSARAPDLEVLFSRGIPGAAGWGALMRWAPAHIDEPTGSIMPARTRSPFYPFYRVIV